MSEAVRKFREWQKLHCPEKSGKSESVKYTEQLKIENIGGKRLG